MQVLIRYHWMSNDQAYEEEVYSIGTPPPEEYLDG